jgi:chromosome segregation ATPase
VDIDAGIELLKQLQTWAPERYRDAVSAVLRGVELADERAEREIEEAKRLRRQLADIEERAAMWSEDRLAQRQVEGDLRGRLAGAERGLTAARLGVGALELLLEEEQAQIRALRSDLAEARALAWETAERLTGWDAAVERADDLIDATVRAMGSYWADNADIYPCSDSLPDAVEAVVDDLAAAIRERDQARADVARVEAERASLAASLRYERQAAGPEWDATDAAHPAWWRGHDHGAAGMARALEEARAERDQAQAILTLAERERAMLGGAWRSAEDQAKRLLREQRRLLTERVRMREERDQALAVARQAEEWAARLPGTWRLLDPGETARVGDQYLEVCGGRLVWEAVRPDQQTPVADDEAVRRMVRPAEEREHAPSVAAALDAAGVR